LEERSTALTCPDGAGLPRTLQWQSWKGKQDGVELFRLLAEEEQRSQFCPEGSVFTLHWVETENSWSRGQKFTLQALFLHIGSGGSCLFWLCDSCMHRGPGSAGGAESLSFILFQSLVVMALSGKQKL